MSAVGRNDYAVNGGENWCGLGPGPAGLAGLSTYGFPSPKPNTGIMMCHNRYKFTDIEDGLSNTFMIGEKSICPDYYATGQTLGDAQFDLFKQLHPGDFLGATGQVFR